MLAEVDGDLALLSGEAVDRLIRGLLRVLHALVDRAADVQDHAAGRVVHLPDELLRLRHEAAAQVAQRGERLVQLLAEIDLLLRLLRLRTGPVLFFAVIIAVVIVFFVIVVVVDVDLHMHMRLFLRLRVHLAQQRLHVAQRGRDLREGLLLALSLRDGILIAGLRVGHQLVAQGEVFHRHLHLREDLVNHAANPLAHHARLPPVRSVGR